MSTYREKIVALLSQQNLEESARQWDATVARLSRYKKVYIYGAGGWGKSLESLLLSQSITTHAFLDKDAFAATPQGAAPVYNPEEFKLPLLEAPDSVVIIALRLAHHDTVRETCASLGFAHIETVCSLWQYGGWHRTEELFALTQDVDAITRACEALEDSQSREIFFVQLESYVTKSYNGRHLVEPNQYFPQSIPGARDCRVFVDCGAYTGDTIESLCAKNLDVNTIVAFEPGAGNFPLLVETARKNGAASSIKVYLYPCCVWSTTQMLNLDSTDGPGCRISSGGIQATQGVALDDAISNVRPTYIKMDVEGAEMNALTGARQLILAHKPELAISVYHQIQDLWQILLFLNQQEKGYRFFLRSHEDLSQETVLYAI